METNRSASSMYLHGDRHRQSIALGSVGVYEMCIYVGSPDQSVSSIVAIIYR